MQAAGGPWECCGTRGALTDDTVRYEKRVREDDSTFGYLEDYPSPSVINIHHEEKRLRPRHQCSGISYIHSLRASRDFVDLSGGRDTSSGPELPCLCHLRHIKYTNGTK